MLEWNFVSEYLLTIQIANRKTKANTTYCHYQTAPNAIACWLRKQSTVGASINIFAYILDSHTIYTIFIHIDWSCFCCPSKHTRGLAPAKRTILNADFVRFTQQRALCLDAHIYHKTNHQKNILPLTIFHARATLFWLLITILVTLFFRSNFCFWTQTFIFLYIGNTTWKRVAANNHLHIYNIFTLYIDIIYIFYVWIFSQQQKKIILMLLCFCSGSFLRFQRFKKINDILSMCTLNRAQ